MLGLGQACRRKAGTNEQLGAKSLDCDRDLGDVHTWPHSHYLMRQCDGVGGCVQLKYRLCMCGCGCEICRYIEKCEVAECASAKSTIWWGKRLAPPSSFILRLSNPFALLIPLLSWPLSDSPFLLGPFPPRCLLPRNCPLHQTPAPEIGCTSEIASDAHLVLSSNLIVGY